jgi:DNA-binding HxlR family transcriptional regulator
MASRVPAPGRPVRGSTTGRPVMAALDLLGRRWALRILWELRSRPLGARDLLAHCQGLSSSVLYERLRELTTAGLLVKSRPGAYALTPMGRDLATALAPLNSWSERWAAGLPRQDHRP